MILLNGTLVEKELINADSGLYFGRGLFETMLVTKVPLFLEEHLERLNNGLEVIGINKKVTSKEVINAVKELKCEYEILKLVVTEKNNIFISRKNNYTNEMYQKGFNVKLSSVKRNSYSPLTYVKSLNYLDNILEHEKCRQEGYEEVVFVNTEDKLAEGSVSNIFFVKNNKIFTPSLECGLLNGTIRKYIIKNYEVVQGEFEVQDLMEAEEAFLTNSVMGIMKINKFCDRSFHEETVSKSIFREYQNYISECYL